MVEIGGTSETWDIIKHFNEEYSKENTTWVHSVNGG